MRHFIVMGVTLAAASLAAAGEFVVAPEGDDSHPGTAARPFATLRRAQQAVREHADFGRRPMTVILKAGTYYLEQPLVFTAEDSGTAAAPVTYRAEQEGQAVLSGGLKLSLAWTPYRDGILQAPTPAGLEIDQLFVNGKRRPMARYPNYDETARPYNGAAADAFDPARAARWADPRGGYIHAMHSAHWGGYHYRITGKNEKHEVRYEGGWQNNRQMGMHGQHRFVENIFEELDAPGEWFHDARKNLLFYLPDDGVDVKTARFEVVRLRHLIEWQGTQEKPVRHLHVRGLVFRHAARTFMDTREPLLRSDWTIYRGGALFLTGAEDVEIADCEFAQVGGNAVFVSRYNRRVTVRGCHIHGSGASGVCFVGDPGAVRNPLFEYHQRLAYAELDRTPGPKSDAYPADCLVEDCLIHDISVVEKQATGVQISMARGIVVRHCSIYKTGRAGINISEGTFGGHVIEGCDVFDTVRETGDHGSFNSWGRDRFWQLQGAPVDELPDLARLDAEKTILRNNRWRCDHGWDVDLDDGSSNYEIYNNVFLRGGLKLREGFHRTVYNNIAIHNGLHPHVWYDQSLDVVTGNVWMAAYQPAGGMPAGRWGKDVDWNLFTRESDRARFAAHQCDLHSLAGDPLFVDPARGDYRVREGSPALKLGFKNFPMDRFGVQKPALRAIAETPELPTFDAAPGPARPPAEDVPFAWQGAELKALTGEAYSAFGVGKEDGGLPLLRVPEGSLAARAGLQAGDLLLSVNGARLRNADDLWKATHAAEGKPLKLGLVRNQRATETGMTRYVYAVFETGAPKSDRIELLPQEAVKKFKRIASQPAVSDFPLEVLTDGKIEAHYGPVMKNGVNPGVYRAEFEAATPVTEVRTWSYHMNGVRGAQKFTLYGGDAKHPLLPIVTVNTTGQAHGAFTATLIRASDRSELGRWERLEWRVEPVTAAGENTSFQEFQVR